MAIDAVTTLENTFCTSGKTKPILHYRAYMHIEKESLRELEAGLAKMKGQQVNVWCTDPELLKLIRVTDVRNVYYDVNRKYIGEINIRSNDCTSSK